MTKEGRVVVVASAVHCCDCSDFAGVESEDGPCFFIFRRRAVAGEKKKRDHGVQSVRMRDRTRSGDGAIFVQSGTSKSRQAILVCGPFFVGSLIQFLLVAALQPPNCRLCGCSARFFYPCSLGCHTSCHALFWD